MGDKGFSQNEVTAALNNAVIVSLQPNWIPQMMTEEAGAFMRVKHMREFVQDMLAPLLEFIDEGLIKAEEMVAILTTAAVYVHGKYVLGGKGKARSLGMASRVIDKK